MKKYDAIVVGAGSAGCVMASRLSEDPSRQILLIEAGFDLGPMESSDIRSPYPMSAYNSNYQWKNLNANIVSGSDVRSCSIPQAKMVGGCSAINAMLALRGTSDDYNEWLAKGINGWSWEDVLPYFKKMETDNDYVNEMHGQNGPIFISRQTKNKNRQIGNAFADICQERGLNYINDVNSDFRNGFFVTPMSTDGFNRYSTNRAYLSEKVRSRSNLKIISNALCEKILFEEKVAKGISAKIENKFETFFSDQIILSTGAIQSPAILMRSGIGEYSQLQRLRIPVIVNLPGVGKNLQNHGVIPLGILLRGNNISPTTQPAAFIGMRANSGIDGGTSDLYFSLWDRSAWHSLGGQIGVLNVVLHKPSSTGSIELKSCDPESLPLIDFNFLSDDRDVLRMHKGIQIALGFLGDPKMKNIGLKFGLIKLNAVTKKLIYRSLITRLISWLFELILKKIPSILNPLYDIALHSIPNGFLPDANIKEIKKALRSAILLQYHQVGTCSMGPENSKMSVTDPTGRVYGVNGLTIVDASILPSVPRGNTNIPVIMAAEKIADLFKEKVWMQKI